MQFHYLKYDLYRYLYFSNEVNKISLFKKIRIILLRQGAWATTVYRIRRWFEYECPYRILKKIFKLISPFLGLLTQVLTGITIGPHADIGPGLYIGHFGSIFLGGDMGKMCNVSHECTIGYAGRGESRGLPELGDFVYVAPGAKIFGKIKIGDYVAIGANAVVAKSIESNAVAVGIPAKVISYKGSSDIITYNKNKFKLILDS